MMQAQFQISGTAQLNLFNLIARHKHMAPQSDNYLHFNTIILNGAARVLNCEHRNTNQHQCSDENPT